MYRRDDEAKVSMDFKLDRLPPHQDDGTGHIAEHTSALTTIGSSDVQGAARHEERRGEENPPQVPFGPFRIQHEKPYSRTYTNESSTAFLKEYRGIAPSARQEREVLAMTRAGRLGVTVPEVLAAGSTESSVWTVFRQVPGHAGSVETPGGLSAFVDQVLRLGRRIHTTSPGLRPGVGWEPSSNDTRTHRGFLLDQFSDQARSQPWWEELRDALGRLDLGPVVYLHGDLKAEHFLMDGDRVSVVDWEACARGPVACDYADALFHVLRDLLYFPGGPCPIPQGLAERLPVPGPVLAFRLLLWLDRRPPHGLRAVDEEALQRLLAATEPTDEVLYRCGSHVIATARDEGVPR